MIFNGKGDLIWLQSTRLQSFFPSFIYRSIQMILDVFFCFFNNTYMLGEVAALSGTLHFWLHGLGRKVYIIVLGEVASFHLALLARRTQDKRCLSIGNWCKICV